MFPQSVPEWEEDSPHFSLVYLLPPFFFFLTVALGVKAEGLQRKLYFHDSILWTESFILLLCECWGYPIAWHGAGLWRYLGALFGVKHGWKELCRESSNTLYRQGCKLLKVSWKSTELLGRAVNVKTYSKSINYSSMEKGELSHWCLFHPQCVYLDQFHVAQDLFSPCPTDSSLGIRVGMPELGKPLKGVQSQWPQGLRGAGKFYPIKICSLLDKFLSEMGWGGLKEGVDFGARMTWAHMIH